MIGSTNAMINGICFNLEKNTKLYTDQLLDDINISDDENQNTAKNTNPNSKNDLTEKEYNMQMENHEPQWDEFEKVEVMNFNKFPLAMKSCISHFKLDLK